MTRNSVMVLFPYRWNDVVWVFDDPTTGLVREAFVQGIDDILDRATADIPNAKKGFLLTFSAQPFPGWMFRLNWTKPGEKGVGNWYYCPQFKINGWLCPALYHYFDRAPKSIFAAVNAAKGPNKNQPKKDKRHEQEIHQTDGYRVAERAGDWD